MKWKFTNDRAIYSQIIEQMSIFIISGKLQPGEKIKAVREIAQEAGVNPNTMQKAFSELEVIGLVYSNRTSGRFVTEDKELISSLKLKYATKKISEFLEQMKSIGYTKKEISDIINKTGDDKNE